MPLLWLSCQAPTPNLADLAEKSRPLLQLESCEFVYHDIIYQGSREKWLGLLTTKDNRLLFSVDIKVTAGLDLDEKPLLRLERGPGPDHDILVVGLPAAHITGVDADEASIHQYFLHEYGWGGAQPVKWLDVQAEIGKAKERAASDATKRGLLDSAWNNAAGALGGFFRLAGFKNVRVEKTGGPA